MTLKALLSKHKAQEVELQYLEHYAKYEARTECFCRVYELLLDLEPEPSESVIHVDWEGENDLAGFNDTGYMNVQVYEKHEKPANGNSFMFSDGSLENWSWWLDCEIDSEVLNLYSERQILAHIIWEMMFHGDGPAAIIEKRKVIEEPRVEKGEKVESVNDFFRYLDEENGGWRNASKIREVKHLENYKIGVYFEDGLKRCIDLKFYIKHSPTPSIKKYADENLFMQMHINNQGDLSWGNDEFKVNSRSIRYGYFDCKF